MMARMLLHRRWGGAAWRRALRCAMAPGLGAACLAATVLAAATDILNDNYDATLQSTITLILAGSLAWALTPAQPPGGLGRRTGQLHLALFTVCAAVAGVTNYTLF